jgi:hypothetical protein
MYRFKINVKFDLKISKNEIIEFNNKIYVWW